MWARACSAPTVQLTYLELDWGRTWEKPREAKHTMQQRDANHTWGKELCTQKSSTNDEPKWFEPKFLEPKWLEPNRVGPSGPNPNLIYIYIYIYIIINIYIYIHIHLFLYTIYIIYFVCKYLIYNIVCFDINVSCYEFSMRMCSHCACALNNRADAFYSPQTYSIIRVCS